MPASSLSPAHRVWPDLRRSSSSTTSSASSGSSSRSNAEFDLVPPSLCSPGVQPFMQQLIALTQPQGPFKPKAGGPGRAKKTQQQQQQQQRVSSKQAGAAAAHGRGRAAKAAAAALPSYGSYGNKFADADLAEGPWWCDDGAAAAAFEDVDSECEAEADWYAEAAQQQVRYTWHDAPAGRFYSLQVDPKQLLKVWLVPEPLMTRGELDSKLWCVGWSGVTHMCSI